MCQRYLRRQMKPAFCQFIGGWEMFYWMGNIGLLIAWWWKRDRESIRNNLLEEFPYETVEDKLLFWNEYNDIIFDWDAGLYIHIYSAAILIPIALILLIGVHVKNKFVLLLYIFLSIAAAINRVAMMIYISRAYHWLRWLECYWVIRVFFSVCIFNYFLDLWDAETNSERVELPLLIRVGPMDDQREFRGAHNYPEFPVALQDRPRIYGRSRHLVTEYAQFNEETFPQYYSTGMDQHGNSRLIIDDPPTAHL